MAREVPFGVDSAKFAKLLEYRDLPAKNFLMGRRLWIPERRDVTWLDTSSIGRQ